LLARLLDFNFGRHWTCRVHLNMGSTFKNMGSRSKPVISITLNDDQQHAFVPSYTSLDEIRGVVSVTASCDIRFDEVYITFEGVIRTYVEKIATTAPTNGRTEAFQNFLRLVQPMDDAVFPEPRIAKAGQTYRFPFTFVVPERLLPQTCNHPTGNDSVRDAHLNLPPSLGDPMSATVGKTLMDDMAPDMGVVAYSVKCRITNGRGSSGKHVIIAEQTKKLRVVPTVEETPPLSVLGGLQDDYKLRKEKDIKKGVFKGKLGRLIIESAQPKSLRLPSINSQSTCPVTTMATVHVRFDPADEKTQPPRLTSLSSKLKVATFFGSIPMREIPTKSNDFHYSNTKGIFVETLNLSSRCIASAQWQHHQVDVPMRRDSAFSTLSNINVPEPSSSYSGKSFYTSKILVPMTLPRTSKLFVPTFHSCLVSRIYALDLYLTVNTPGATTTSTTLHLKLPVQVSSEGNPSRRPSIADQEAEAAAAAAASDTTDFFHPRSLAPPSPEYTERAQLASMIPSASPEYTERSQSVSLASPSPEYTERPRPASFAPSSREHAEFMRPTPRFESAPPPGYSFSSGRHHRIRMDLMSPMGMMPVGG